MSSDPTDPDFDVVDDTPVDTPEIDRESTFDQLRIENHKALRMGAIRARSWWVITQWLAVVTLLDMLINIAGSVWSSHRFGIWPVLRLVVVGFAFVVAKHAHRRALDFKREIEQSALAEPAEPPDFSTLGDGSDQWKRLEDVR